MTNVLNENVSISIQTIEDKNNQTDDEITFEQIENNLLTSYDNSQINNSTICDVIAIYLKGQNILYTEAKTLCEQRLTVLMLPAIFFTIICSILNLLFKDSIYGPIIGSLLNGFVAFLLAIVNYLKLDARAEAHRTSAYKFDKLISYIEFNSGKMIFIENEYKKIGEVISYVENNVKEIKETNQFVLPEKIRFNFPKLCNINIFSEVKRRQNKEAKIIIDIVKCANKIQIIDNLLKNNSETNINQDNLMKEKNILISLKELREDEFYLLKNDLLDIDNEFEYEMKIYREKEINRYKLKICDYFKV